MRLSAAIAIISLHPATRDVHMSEMPPELPAHPRGTLAFLGLYALIFVCLWYAIYYLVFLARQPVTP